MLMDTGASQHVIDPTQQKALQGGQPTQATHQKFSLPNGTTMVGTETFYLPLPLEAPAKTGTVLKGMVGGSILSVAQLADSGLSTMFTPEEVRVTSEENEVIMRAPRHASGLWYFTPEKESEQDEPVQEGQNTAQRIAAVRSYQQRVNLLTDSERVQFAHAVMGYPPYNTFLQSVERFQFPLLTTDMVRSNPPSAVETQRGHMTASRQGFHSSQPEEPAAGREQRRSNTVEAPKDTEKVADMLCRLHTVYADATGPYVPTTGGNIYVMVVYSTAINYIFLRAMKSKTEYSSTILAVEQEITSRGHRVQKVVTDNEITREALQTMQERSIELAVQCVPPYNHRANDAERHVQTAKAHIISSWEGRDKRTPDSLWGEQLPQAEVTLNLLRPGPKGMGSAFQALWGHPYDWERYPMMPIGTWGEAHVPESKRSTWGARSEEVVYLGPAWDHYRCYRVYRPSTGKMVYIDSVSWHPRTPMPDLTPHDAVRFAMNHLRNAVEKLPDQDEWGALAESLTTRSNDMEATGARQVQEETKQGSTLILRDHGGKFGADMRALDPKGKHGYGTWVCPDCDYQRCQCVELELVAREQKQEQQQQNPVTATTKEPTAMPEPTEMPGKAEESQGTTTEGQSQEISRRSRTQPAHKHGQKCAREVRTYSANQGRKKRGSNATVKPIDKEPRVESQPAEATSDNSFNVLEGDDEADYEGGEPKHAEAVEHTTTTTKTTRGYPSRHRKPPTKFRQLNRVTSAPGGKTIIVSSTKLSKAERYEPASRNIEQGAIYEELIAPEPRNSEDNKDEQRAKDILDAEAETLQWWEDAAAGYETLLPCEKRVARLIQDGVRLNYSKAMLLEDAEEWREANYAEWERNVITRKSWRPIHPHEKQEETIPSYVVPILEQKEGKSKRIRLAYDGNRSQYEGPRSSRTVSMQAKKIMLNHIISTGKECMTADVSDFYLAEPNVLPSLEYMWCPMKCLTPKIIEDFQLKDKISKGRVLLEISRPVYGLNQAGLIAMQSLKRILEKHGYVECDNECIFRSNDPLDDTIFCIHVDDLMFAYSNTPQAEQIMQVLRKEGYNLKVENDPRMYCGFHITINREERSITAAMPTQVQNMLVRFNLTNVQKRMTPYPTSRPKYTGRQTTAPQDDSRPLNENEIRLLQEKIGCLLYLAMAVRCDIVTHVSKVSSQQATPTERVMKDTDHIFGYLRQFPNRGIKYYASDMQLKAYTDASFDTENKSRSRSGAVFYFGRNKEPSFVNGPIDHISRIQTTTHAMSSAEAEYVALYLCTMRAIYLRNLTEIFGHKQGPTPISCDNACAVGLANDQVADGRTKHVERKYHFTRSIIAKGMVSVYWQAGTSNLADFFTKRLDEETHWRFTNLFTVDIATNQ
jgi:hypothetical protein